MCSVTSVIMLKYNQLQIFRAFSKKKETSTFAYTKKLFQRVRIHFAK